MSTFVDLTPTEIAMAGLAVMGVASLVEAVVRALADRYCVLVLPRHLYVFRPWFAVGRVVHHPELGRCQVARLDRSADLGGFVWACVYPLIQDDEDLVPAQWVPVSELGETSEEAAELPGDLGGGQ